MPQPQNPDHSRNLEALRLEMIKQGFLDNEKPVPESIRQPLDAKSVDDFSDVADLIGEFGDYLATIPKQYRNPIQSRVVRMLDIVRDKHHRKDELIVESLYSIRLEIVSLQFDRDALKSERDELRRQLDERE